MNALAQQVIEPGVVRGRWWHRLEAGRIQCDLCPRACKLKEGQRGFCYVRQAREEGIVLTSYGRASGFRVDPIEKKPLYHYYPGTGVLSFGTAGCNLGCRFCQNWDISKAREDDCLQSWASPAAIVENAAARGCAGIAFTYNDPVVFAEYAMDCAVLARQHGIKTVAVTAGYMNPGPRREFYALMDAVNVDLKAFTEEFYHQWCFAQLAPVLETLRWIKHETHVWLEVTTLLIPGHNDSEREIERLCRWYARHLGPDVPLHFTAFFPSYKMLDVPSTPSSTLARARAQARAAGIHHVYTGNVEDVRGQSTYCADCGGLLIERDRDCLGRWNLDHQGRCSVCGTRLPGWFAGQPGQWTGRPQPASILRTTQTMRHAAKPTVS